MRPEMSQSSDRPDNCRETTTISSVPEAKAHADLTKLALPIVQYSKQRIIEPVSELLVRFSKALDATGIGKLLASNSATDLRTTPQESPCVIICHKI